VNYASAATAVSADEKLSEVKGIIVRLLLVFGELS